MRRILGKKNILFQLVCVFLLSCTPSKKTELAWEKNLYLIGSQSSPRVVDLNQDGVGDIVMGAGREEIAPSDYGVFAIDGNSGELLWKQATNAQIVGSAQFQDINGDSISDIFIGGRNANLKALDGRTGSLIWEYAYSYEDDPLLRYAQYNFYNGQWIPDQNGDGYQELLTVNGGNWLIAPDTMKGREPGVLMVFDPLNGKVLAADTMPDGAESYLSPLYLPDPSGQAGKIVFGSGGETQSGNLYIVGLSDLMEANLENAQILFSEQGHGFIAPPSLADVNQDGIQDILAVSHAGRIRAINGSDLSVLWEKSYPGYESSNNMSLGQFTGDAAPDLLVWLSKGKWPLYTHSKGMVLDGSNGKLAYSDSSACFTLASPVVYDINKDGWDEAILSQNVYDCSLNVLAEDSTTIEVTNELIAIDFHAGRVQSIDKGRKHKNFFSSPWVGDLDSDGYLDIVYTHYFHGTQLQKFMGMRVRRISSSIRMKGAPKWGEYMGKQGRGIYVN